MALTTDQAIRPSAYQAKVLAFRGHCGIVAGGGRGGGKSFALLLDVLDHCQAADARPFRIRRCRCSI